MDLTSAMDGIAKLSEQAIPLEEGDYIGEDGLYYCHNCNTPKQVKVENPFVAGQFDIRSCLCKCRVAKRNAEDAERQRIAFEREVKELRRRGFPESNMQDWTFENNDGEGDQKIMTAAKAYVENFKKMLTDGKGLLLFGNVGSGKTYAAACIVNALIDKGYPCVMTNFSRIANTAQGLFDGRQEYFDSFNRFPLIVLDDFKAERSTDFMNEIIHSIIDSRYRAGLPLIITTNLTNDELKHPADITNQRTFSRLLEMCIPIEVTGKDRRRSILKETFDEYSEILGLKGE